MTDREAFVRAICADRADDMPRLVYADWLEENGEPERAEFARVQVELARDWNRRPHGNGDWKTCHGCVLERRGRELLGRHWRQWAPDLGIGGREVCTNLTGDDRPGVTFRRGFVAALTCSAEDWLRVADDVYWHPDQTVPCETCNGNGWTTEPDGCPGCRPKFGSRGSGRVPRPFPAGAGRTAECPECRGSRHRRVVRVTKACPFCRSGRVPAPAALPQPIEEVQLTTTDWLAWAGPVTSGGNGTFTDPRWPGILFRTPGTHRPA